jgi:hypothetical protein
MARKTGEKIRYKGHYKVYENGTVSTFQYNLTDAFDTTSAITVEELQVMTIEDIEARASAMINWLSRECTNVKLLNNVIYTSNDCSDNSETEDNKNTANATNEDNDYYFTGEAYAGVIVYKKYENGREVDSQKLEILKGDYQNLPEPRIDEKSKIVFITTEEYIARLEYIESLFMSEWDGLRLSYKENYIKSSSEECTQSCHILVVWSNHECIIDEKTIIEGESFISYKPVKVASAVNAYIYNNESSMKEDINNGAFSNSIFTLVYSLSDMTNAPTINALTVYKNQVLEDILKKTKTEFISSNLCSTWIIEEYNSYWENATEECSDEFTATGEWRDKVCYILPDGSFNGECYFLNLVINLNDNK